MVGLSMSHQFSQLRLEFAARPLWRASAFRVARSSGSSELAAQTRGHPASLHHGIEPLEGEKCLRERVLAWLSG
jgi:hypothetical protein